MGPPLAAVPICFPASAARMPFLRWVSVAEPVLRWRRVFSGQAAQLRELRRWLTALLPEAPARDDVLMVAVELATNAIKHSASRRDGFFAV